MIEKFRNAMQSEGIAPPAKFTTDGNLHRFHVQGDKTKSRNGWYILFDDLLAGSFGCWKRGIQRNWSSREYQHLTPTEKVHHKANIGAIKRKREAELVQIHATCREASTTIWKKASPASENHPYLARKDVEAYGLKEYRGSLVVPVRDNNRTLHGLQFINANGRKLFESGTNKRGNYYLLGPRFGRKPKTILYLTEGFATAASIYTATGKHTVVCFDAGNLKPVAEVLREKYPEIKIVLCADNDQHKGDQNNTGVIKATEAAQSINGLLAIPQFPEGTTGSDFNDLMTVADIDEVKRQVKAARKPEPTPDKESAIQQENPSSKLKVVPFNKFLQSQFPPREMLLAPWLPSQGLCMVYAPRGVGKTHFSLGVAFAVASGGIFLNWQAAKPRGVLFIDGEMPGQTLQERLNAIAINNDSDTEINLNIVTPDLQPVGMLNLSETEGQNLLSPYLDGIDLIIVDNLSTLCRSGKENDGDSWLPVQQWALQQRAAGRSVLFIHHAGKNGEQRGSSRREDVLDTVIALRRQGDYTPDKGASFEVHFEKARGLFGEGTKPFEATLITTGSRQRWEIKPLEQSTAEKVASYLNEGIPQSEIAEILGVAKGTVSKAKQRAKTQGLLNVS